MRGFHTFDSDHQASRTDPRRGRSMDKCTRSEANPHRYKVNIALG
jgi:hypothetical protein